MTKQKRCGPRGLPKAHAARVRAALSGMHAAEGSDRKVAEKLGGVDASTVYRVRKGKVLASLATAAKVATALDCTTVALLDGSASVVARASRTTGTP